MDDLREAVEENIDMSYATNIVIKRRILWLHGRLADPRAESVSENSDCLSWTQESHQREPQLRAIMRRRGSPRCDFNIHPRQLSLRCDCLVRYGQHRTFAEPSHPSCSLCPWQVTRKDCRRDGGSERQVLNLSGGRGLVVMNVSARW